MKPSELLKRATADGVRCGRTAPPPLHHYSTTTQLYDAALALRAQLSAKVGM